MVKTIRQAILKKPYWRASSKMSSVYAFYPVGTLVEVISRGKGKGVCVLLPENEFYEDTMESWKGRTEDLKFITGEK